MRQFTIGPWLKAFGWLATAVMALAAMGMIATWVNKRATLPSFRRRFRYAGIKRSGVPSRLRVNRNVVARRTTSSGKPTPPTSRSRAWKLCASMKAQDVTATLDPALAASGLD
jgi:hypothetical protein